MPARPVELPRFGGLDLNDDPQNVDLTSAIDLLNVDFEPRGTVRSRDGYVKWTTAALGSRINRVWGMYDPYSGSHRLLASQWSSGLTTAYDTSAVVQATSGVTPGFGTWTHFGGSGSTSAMYSGYGLVDGQILKYTVSGGFTSPAAGYSAQYVAVQPQDNRLVLGLTTEAAGASRLRFSDRGTPETFSANNFVDLVPNDGSAIQGLYVYGNQLFAFKDNRFFVFYGNSVDGSGNPVFNYRTIDVGIGMRARAGGCSSPNGIYFFSEDGIYLTTGGPPVKVSKALDPLFAGRTPAAYGGTDINLLSSAINSPQMEWLNGRLYVALPTGTGVSTNDRLFVLDPDAGWLVWNIPASGLVSWVAPDQQTHVRSMYFSYSTGTNDIGYINPGATTDAGTAITSRYRTGFWSPGQPGSESWIREVLLDGSGSVTVKTAVNDAATLGAGVAVALGTSPAIAQGRDRRGLRGRNVSYEFSGSAPWSLSRVTPMLWGQTSPGAKAA